MARRPNQPASEQLQEAQLAELRERLARIPRHELEIFYRATHNACRYVNRLPSARLIQELVQAWKELRQWPWAKFARSRAFSIYSKTKMATLSDEDILLLTRTLEHYHAYLLASQRQDPRYLELAERLKPKGPEAVKRPAQHRKRG